MIPLQEFVPAWLDMHHSQVRLQEVSAIEIVPIVHDNLRARIKAVDHVSAPRIRGQKRSRDRVLRITAGKRPGTYVYTLPKTPNAPARSAAAEQNAHMPPPLTITAAQANALRDA